MGIIIMLLVGVLVGWLASMVVGSGGGILFDMIVGILGALIAGFLFGGGASFIEGPITIRSPGTGKDPRPSALTSASRLDSSRPASFGVRSTTTGEKVVGRYNPSLASLSCPRKFNCDVPSTKS